ncbi:hypothetical protein [Mycobacteroides chelonae]|uniref:hypothetical protein n=1 Tax=Mycobacteroides chelonae TaxID=1774 RepID=UPI0008A90148|nr:hypothetical protein [Mycobacteroides chelonae]OHU13143.1 hypothetical protein BKG75_16985 [Mycobacteroides chelonae]
MTTERSQPTLGGQITVTDGQHSYAATVVLIGQGSLIAEENRVALAPESTPGHPIYKRGTGGALSAFTLRDNGHWIRTGDPTVGGIEACLGQDLPQIERAAS